MKCYLEKGYTMKTILNITNKTHSRSGGEKTRGNAQKKQEQMTQSIGFSNKNKK